MRVIAFFFILFRKATQINHFLDKNNFYKPLLALLIEAIVGCFQEVVITHTSSRILSMLGLLIVAEF